MRKSGLHKQISSIFDGVPVPTNSTLTEESDLSAELTEPTTQQTAEQEPLSATTPKLTPTGPSLVQRMSGDSSECESVPVVQVGRPMPLPKSKVMSQSSMGPSLSAQIKKRIFGSQGSIDPRQKKAGVLVGILSLVFAVVLFVSLGGVGKTQANAAEPTHGDTASQSQAAKKTAQDWKRPNPLPENLRNATSPVAMHSSATQQGPTPVTDELIVKGIVFSKNKPSAIINNQILSEGQTFNGVTIVKIHKDTVEFEANEKRWSQSVQR